LSYGSHNFVALLPGAQVRPEKCPFYSKLMLMHAASDHDEPVDGLHSLLLGKLFLFSDNRSSDI